MTGFPQHKSSMYSDFGVRLRRIKPLTDDHAPVTYAHQDDYYVFGLLEGGSACGIVDFKVLHLAAGDTFLIQPGQVHRFVIAENAEGWLLMVDSSFVGSAEKLVFDDFSLFTSSFQIDEVRKKELQQIALLLAGRVESVENKQTKTIVRRLAETFVGVVAEAVQDINLQQADHSRRHMEIVLSFRRLLAEYLATSRKPSYYASLLNISTVYLNEVVKSVTGMNATLYIRSEVVLRAKRLLVHTDLAGKEIAVRLGIDDCAYFSRLFTQTTGVSPSLFRQRNLE